MHGKRIPLSLSTQYLMPAEKSSFFTSARHSSKPDFHSLTSSADGGGFAPSFGGGRFC